MPWAAGTFNLVYQWTTDRDTGIKIRADRMMGQETDIARGMEQLLLRGGANSPTADINWGGHLITNYGPGGSNIPTMEDVVTTLRQIEWLPETAVVTWISNTAFVIVGDKTATYRKGRRVQLDLTTGVGDLLNKTGTVVQDSTFSLGMTTVTVEMDNAPPSITDYKNLRYSLISTSVEDIVNEYPGPSVFDTMSRALTRLSADFIVASPGTGFVIPWGLPEFDTRGEFSGAQFIAQMTGYYWAQTSISYNWLGAVNTASVDLNLIQSPLPAGSIGYTNRAWNFTTSPPFQWILSVAGLFHLNKGDHLYAGLSTTQITTSASLRVAMASNSRMEVYRLPGL